MQPLKKFVPTFTGKFGIVSTGGPVPPARESLALDLLVKLNYQYLQDYSCSKYYADYTFGFSNGSPQMRISAIERMLNDTSIGCLLAARGATGSLEILKNLPYGLWKENPKLLIGNSDVTSILLQMVSKCGIPAIHGATLGSAFADYDNSVEAKISVDSLISMITDRDYRIKFDSKSILKESAVSEGFLLAGNLTMLAALLGTEFDIDYQDAILIIEEVGEAPYRVQRLLDQLYLAGKFDRLKGLCFGRFSKPNSANSNGDRGPSMEEVIGQFCNSRLAPFTFPILTGLEVGHWGTNLPVPIGCKAEIRDGVVYQLQSPLE